MKPVAILGCGYSGRRVARRLLARRIAVIATTRPPPALDDLRALGAQVERLDFPEPDSRELLRRIIPAGALVLISIPTLRRGDQLFDPTPQLVEALGTRPSRVLYLSTTGVYGNRHDVDESTPPAPVTERQRLRMAAEEAVAAGPWPSLILRCAAIYGPHRGVHQAMREERYKLVGAGANFISRIHVDDLALLCERALLSDLTGAYPVADDEPCPSREIAAFCARILGLPLPPAVGPDEVDETRLADRRVDSSAIRNALGIELHYPSYRVGIPAAIEQEAEE